MTFTQQMSFFFPKQTDEQEVITFLLTTEIIPLCLRIMEAGSELSKTVSMLTVRFLLLSLGGPLQHLVICFCPSKAACFTTSNQDISPRLESRGRIFRLLLSAFHFSYPVNFYVGMSCGVALFS